jgi:hypothetical protein
MRRPIVVAQFQFIEVQERTVRTASLWTVDAESAEEARERVEGQEGTCSAGWDVGDEIVFGESGFSLIVNGDRHAATIQAEKQLDHQQV